MAHDDMDHMQHIESVALSDCAVLQTKEATYQGSWKRAGGRSAWFMARRNLDRLIEMMKAPTPPHVFNVQNVRDLATNISKAGFDNKTMVIDRHAHPSRYVEHLNHLCAAYASEDIFAKIRERPHGDDGTVLAVIRDARRYFMLVEAEMIAEGVVEPESQTYEQEARIYVEPDTDVYQLIADEKGLSREEVKQRIHDLFYPAPLPNPPLHGHVVHGVEVHNDFVTLVAPGAQSNPDCKVETSNGGYAAEQAARRKAEAVADGGSQHAVQVHAMQDWSLVPWQIDASKFDLLRRKIGSTASLFYAQRASNLYQLEPIVIAAYCPEELYQSYDSGGGPLWVLKRKEVPPDIYDNFPLVQLEKNQKEYEESDKTFQFMYKFDDGDLKWKLLAEYAAWGRDVG